jgi:hypothetical protein
MKIGLSYSRCVRDIVDGKVDIEDVLVIVARTDFDPRDDEQWRSIWQGYDGGSNSSMIRGYFGGSNSEWAGYTNEDQFRSVSIELLERGKLHQPRQFGARPSRLPYYWLEASLPADELESNPAVKKAWEQFQIVAGLSKSTKILKDDF